MEFLRYTAGKYFRGWDINSDDATGQYKEGTWCLTRFVPPSHRGRSIGPERRSRHAEPVTCDGDIECAPEERSSHFPRTTARRRRSPSDAPHNRDHTNFAEPCDKTQNLDSILTSDIHQHRPMLFSPTSSAHETLTDTKNPSHKDQGPVRAQKLVQLHEHALQAERSRSDPEGAWGLELEWVESAAAALDPIRRDWIFGYELLDDVGEFLESGEEFVRRRRGDFGDES